MSETADETASRPDDPPLDAAFLCAILEHVAHPIFVKDRAFRFVLVNDALSQMVSIHRSELLGRTDYDFFPKREADHFRAKDEEVFARGEVVEVVEERITDAAGTIHVLATTKVPLRDRRGVITHLVGIIHDISALARAREDLRARNAQLEAYLSERGAALREAEQELMRRQRLAVIGQISGGISHQVRNPLAAIRNAAYLLRLSLRDTLSEDARRCVEVIEEEVRRADRIISDLLDYARVRSAERKVCSLGYLASQAIGGVAVPDGVVVHAEIPDACEVNVDGEQVQRALFNLLRNAVEAARQGDAGSPREVRVEVSVEDEVVRIWIRDTGAGLPEAVRAQLDAPAETTQPSSVGLGLMTARALVENQGGALRYHDNPGGGSCFEVVLPRG